MKPDEDYSEHVARRQKEGWRVDRGLPHLPHRPFWARRSKLSVSGLDLFGRKGRSTVEWAPCRQSDNLLLFPPEAARKPTCRKAVGIEALCTQGPRGERRQFPVTRRSMQS